MCKRIVAVIMIAAFWGGQLPPIYAQEPAAPVPAHPIQVTAGTVVQLNLVTSIRSLSTKPGDTVRAAVAFPVTVKGRLAIPAGSFVEGQLKQSFDLDKRGKKTPNLQIHFTRLLLANGYSVPLDAINTTASAHNPVSATSPAQSLALFMPAVPAALFGILPAEGQTTMPPNPGMPGPNPAIIIPAIVGGFVALTVGLYAFAHHNRSNYEKNTDIVLYDAGWQFQMSLSQNIVLDADQVAAAASVPAKN